MDSIQVDEPQQYLSKQQQNEDRFTAQFRKGLSWSVGIILFIVVVVYAGVRGNQAYNHDPVVVTTFATRSSILFPAVTVCPVVPAGLTAIECAKEVTIQVTDNCLSMVYSRDFTIEGQTHVCLTFNDPQNNSLPFSSESVDDELAIQVLVNSTNVPNGEPIGVLVMVHSQGVDPIIEDDSSFIANVGEVTESWLRYEENILINGQQGDKDYLTTVSAANKKGDASHVYVNIADVDFSFTLQGAFINTQYYAYTPDNWLGEVGGLACLLWFLHWAFCGIIVFIFNRIRNRGKGMYRINT